MDDNDGLYRINGALDVSPRSYGEFPAIDGVPEDKLLEAIRNAGLPPEGRQLAIGRLIWHTKYIVLGEVLGMSRTTASRTLKYRIVPRIIRALEKAA